MFSRTAITLAAAFFLVTAAEARVDYAIDLTRPEHHEGKVSIAFPRADGPYLDIKMPAWRTGRYNILNLANGVRDFAATDAEGRPLRWQKVDKSTWRIQLPAATEVKVSYSLYANELGQRTRHIDDSHAYLNPSAVFMYADRTRADDVTVALTVPDGWTSVSGMASTGAHRFAAANWDVLTDSPIETGRNQRFAFREGGRDYEVVFWGEGNYDTAQTVADLQKIVAQAPTIWSGYPFRRYVFIVHATDGAGGATEHLNSTVIQRPRDTFRPRDRYLDFLSTASHEFIHTWNVKAYRGAGLVPYNFQSENYDPTLWIAEGSTSYFSDQLLLSAGIMKPADYYAHLADVIAAHQRRPGAGIQSVAEASFDEWIAVGGDRANNASVNIYGQGEVASWLLDIALLERTGGRIGYRQVHDALYRRFPATQRGFTEADVRQIMAELTGSNWDRWWADNIDTPLGQPDFARLLAPVGLQISYANADRPKPWAGWTGTQGVGGMRLSAVERGSPAWTAGFTPEDVIVAFNGRRVTPERFGAALEEMKVGDTVTVSYFRRDRLEQKQMKLGADRGKPTVSAVARPTAMQRKLYERWVRAPFPSR